MIKNVSAATLLPRVLKPRVLGSADVLISEPDCTNALVSASMRAEVARAVLAGRSTWGHEVGAHYWNSTVLDWKSLSASLQTNRGKIVQAGAPRLRARPQTSGSEHQKNTTSFRAVETSDVHTSITFERLSMSRYRTIGDASKPTEISSISCPFGCTDTSLYGFTRTTMRHFHRRQQHKRMVSQYVQCGLVSCVAVKLLYLERSTFPTVWCGWLVASQDTTLNLG